MEPRDVTLESLLMSSIMSFLGADAGDPMMGMFAPQLSGIVKSLAAGLLNIPQDSPMWTTTLYTNMTDFGRVVQNMNTAATKAAIVPWNQFKRTEEYKFYEGIQRSLMSREAFEKRVAAGEDTGGFTNYDAFLAHKTSGMVDNFAWDMLYTMADPQGTMQAAFNMKNAAINIGRNAMWRGDRDWMEKQEAIGRLFMDKNANSTYNNADYGGFSLNDTTALLSALSKDINFAQGGESIEDASKRLREKMQAVTRALSPLKDLFGDDIPSMIKLMENITGRSIGQLDTAKIKGMTERFMNGVLTNTYTAEQVVMSNHQLQAGYSQMNIPFYINNTLAEQSRTLAAVANIGWVPDGMSRTEFVQNVARRTMKTGASRFANNANLAAAVWMDQQRSNGRDVTFNDFEREYNRRIAAGMTYDTAFRDMTGMTSAVLHYEGYMTPTYIEAQQANVGQRMANRQGTIRGFGRAALTSRTRADADAWRYLGRVFAGAELSDLTGQELDKALREHENVAVRRVYSAMNTDERYQDLATAFAARSAEREADKRQAVANRIRRQSDLIAEAFSGVNTANSPGEAIVNALINNGKGFSMAAINEAMAKDATLKQLVTNGEFTKQDWEEMHAAQDVAIRQLGPNATETEKKSAAAKGIMTLYRTKGENALRDSLFESFRKAKGSDKTNIAMAMKVAEDLGADTSKRFMETFTDEKTGFNTTAAVKELNKYKTAAEADFAALEKKKADGKELSKEEERMLAEGKSKYVRKSVLDKTFDRLIESDDKLPGKFKSHTDEKNLQSELQSFKKNVIMGDMKFDKWIEEAEKRNDWNADQKALATKDYMELLKLKGPEGVQAATSTSIMDLFGGVNLGQLLQDLSSVLHELKSRLGLGGHRTGGTPNE